MSKRSDRSANTTDGFFSNKVCAIHRCYDTLGTQKKRNCQTVNTYDSGNSRQMSNGRPLKDSVF